MNSIINEYPVTNTINNNNAIGEGAKNLPQNGLFSYVLDSKINPMEYATPTVPQINQPQIPLQNAYAGLNQGYNQNYYQQNNLPLQNGQNMYNSYGQAMGNGNNLLNMLNSTNNTGGNNNQIIMMLMLMLLGNQNTNNYGAQNNYANMGYAQNYGSPIANKVIADAQSMIGTKYSNTDCSDLIELVFRKSGIDFANSPHGTTAAGIAKYIDSTGQTLTKDQLAPGDLIFWRKDGCNCGRYQEIHHVGIYLNDNTILDSLPDGGVQIREMWGNDGGKWNVIKYGRPVQPL